MSDDFSSEGKYQEELDRLEQLNELMKVEFTKHLLQANDAIEIWVTQNKRRIDYKKLTLVHLNKIVALLKRTGWMYCCPRLIIEHRRRNGIEG